MPTLLVTGHSGFVGGTLFGAAARDDVVPAQWRLVSLPDGLDVRDAALHAALRDLAPDAVLHLAASTNVDESFRDPDACMDVNFRGTLNLLRGLRACAFRGRLLYVSSGDCYGALASEQLPVKEPSPLRPRNPYAVSKVATEALCYQWSQTESLDVVIARPFNHIGPGQDERFAVPSFCAQVARIEAGRQKPAVQAGNLHVSRDFSDVRDVLRAYFALLERGVAGEAYNVASGTEVVLADLLQKVLAMAGVKAQVELSGARRRAAEQQRVVADIGKIHRDTGWRPVIPLDRTLDETLQYWRRRVRDE